jgi:hypothetical protein
LQASQLVTALPVDPPDPLLSPQPAMADGRAPGSSKP